MIFPRIIALSEVVWSKPGDRDWADFQSRLFHHYRMLQQLRVNYCRPSDQLEIRPEIDLTNRVSQVTISSEQYKPEIRYTTDGSMPGPGSSLYDGPFQLKGSGIVKAAIIRDQEIHREPDSVDIDLHLAAGKKVTYNTPYSSSYPAQKELTLVNGYRGTLTYQDGQWQGLTNDLDVIIDIQSTQSIGSIRSTFMQLIGPGVNIPDYVEVSISSDGRTYEQAGKEMNDISPADPSLRFKTFSLDIKGKKARYIRFFAKLHDGFMFADEIRVNH